MVQSYSEAAAGQTSCLQTAAAAIPAPSDCVQTCCVVLHTANMTITCHMSYVGACCMLYTQVSSVSSADDIHLAGSLTLHNSRNTAGN